MGEGGNFVSKILGKSQKPERVTTKKAKKISYSFYDARFEFFTVVKIKSMVSSVVALCRVMFGQQRFGRQSTLHLLR
jgi:hypothetical protein